MEREEVIDRLLMMIGYFTAEGNPKVAEVLKDAVRLLREGAND